ncbi:hypothetical protein JW756_06815 [Candidatus Woesearchaeota archaeon]|nr:hypothetical protein [Candidatus Woesearchaeota archaeon]
MKGKIFAMGQENKYSYFIFEKKQYLLSLLLKMLDISALQEEYVKEMIYLNYDFDDPAPENKLKEKNIKRMIDERYSFSDHDFRCDVIFGFKRVFIICNANKSTTRSLRDFVAENFEFVKPKKIKSK